MASDSSDEFGARLWGGQEGFSSRLTTLIALAFPVAAAWFGWSEWQVRRSLEWPTTTATVITHGSTRGKGGGRGSPRYQTVVLYDYTINGIVFHGNRLAFHIPDEFDGQLSPYAAVSVGMNRFPMGSSFPAYYDPSAPGESILLRTRADWAVTGILCAIGLGVSALAVWFTLQDRKAAAKRYPRLWPLPANASLVPTTFKGKKRRDGRGKGRP